MNILMNKFFKLFQVLCLSVLLIACSGKGNSTKQEISANAPVQEQSANSQTTQQPTIDAGYLAIFAKTKENMARSLSNNPGNFRAGQHYTDLGRASLQAEKIEVMEFFSYGCGACFSAEPAMHAYAEQLADDVVFKRTPVSFNSSFEILARGYYAANALGVSEEAHLGVFDAIHIKKQNLMNEKALANFYAQYGVDKDKFLKSLRSFSVNSQIERDRKLAQAYQVNSVPTVIVNGAYKTGGVEAGTMDAWMQILDTLVNKERASR